MGDQGSDRVEMLEVSQQDKNTLLAALALYLNEGMCDPANRPDYLHDIATDGDTEIAMDERGVDDLRDRLNRPASDQPQYWREEVVKGLIREAVKIALTVARGEPSKEYVDSVSKQFWYQVEARIKRGTAPAREMPDVPDSESSPARSPDFD